MPLSDIIHQHFTKLLTNKCVSILGYGAEGQSTHQFLTTYFPQVVVKILDQKRDPDYLEYLKDTDVIFRTPGIPIASVKAPGAYLTSQTQEFFTLFGKQTIAVTGTKGKSTASFVLVQILQAAGKKVHFLGNIGTPAFDHLLYIEPTDYVVYETSAHQCEGLNVSPHIGIILNLYREHLDYYHTFENYAQAKKQLFTHQNINDFCIYNGDDAHVGELIKDLASQKIAFGASTEKISLLGRHNLYNVDAALKVAHVLNLDQAKVLAALGRLSPVKNRLQTIGVKHDITFVDDALATIPEATLAALDTFGAQVWTLIAGGFDRGQDFENLATKIAASQIGALILFPTTGEKIAALVSTKTQKIKIFHVNNMPDAVALAFQNTPPGKIALLSAASASFGLFVDYKDRSQKFEEAVYAYP